MEDHYDPSDFEEGVMCPRCSGGGWLNCYCGGDLCVCDNQGEAECYFCDGGGLVSEGEHEAFRLRERQAHCPGHVASEGDPKVCGRCGIRIEELA